MKTKKNMKNISTKNKKFTGKNKKSKTQNKRKGGMTTEPNMEINIKSYDEDHYVIDVQPNDDIYKSILREMKDTMMYQIVDNVFLGEEIIVPDSSATNTVQKKGDKSVLVIVYSLEMELGDYFRVGVLSEDPKVAIINSYPTLGRENLPEYASNSADPICITLCQKIS